MSRVRIPSPAPDFAPRKKRQYAKSMTRRSVLFSTGFLWMACSALAQTYKLEPISTPAPELPAAYSAVIDSTGYRITGPSGPWCEIWFRKAIPTGAAPTDAAIVLPFTQGTLLGVLRFPSAGYDRRGQPVKAGVYTLRYSLYPVDGAHQGVAPQRDFALLTAIGRRQGSRRQAHLRSPGPRQCRRASATRIHRSSRWPQRPARRSRLLKKKAKTTGC